MNTQRLRSEFYSLATVLVAVALLASAAAAQPAGVVATLDGAVEIGRRGEWVAAAIGMPVEIGDSIRTGRPGRARIALRDESVVNVGDDSQLVIDEQVFDPEGGAARSVLELLNGKMRAIVSEHYREPQATFEVKTKTAVSGVRGTDFIMVHDRDSELTQVVGVSGLVDVNGTIDVARNGVVVSAQEITDIRKGGYPTPPRRVDQTTFRQYLDGLEFIGFGLPESLLLENPLFDGDYVPPADRVTARTGIEPPGGTDIPRGAGAGVPVWEFPDVSQSVDQPPGAAGQGEVGIHF